MIETSRLPDWTGGASASFDDVRRCIKELASRAPLDLGRGVWIHGAGGFGRKVANALAACGQIVLGFIDQNADRLGEVDGFPVFHPDRIGASEVEAAFHVHGLMNHYASSIDITEWAVDRGFAGMLFPADLYRIPGFSLSNYWLSPPADIELRLDFYQRVFERLDDEESRSLLSSLLRYRATTDPRDHPAVAMSDAYCPSFLPVFDRPITFVDGGAYTGDTFEALRRRGVQIIDWIAFEPDRRNMLALRSTAEKYASSCNYTLLEFGLSDHEGIVSFTDGAGEASCITPKALSTASATIGVVRLDDMIHRNGSLYVKLDIEGAELGALEGMTRLLQAKPLLAVSIYHQPDDLWEIPSLLMKRDGTARFMIRQHGHHAFDTVFYMIPN